jgi:hypothetical protein
VINHKLEDAIAIGSHLIQVRQSGSNERSGGKGNQGGAANNPRLKFPGFAHGL